MADGAHVRWEAARTCRTSRTICGGVGMYMCMWACTCTCRTYLQDLEDNLRRRGRVSNEC